MSPARPEFKRILIGRVAAGTGLGLFLGAALGALGSWLRQAQGAGGDPAPWLMLGLGLGLVFGLVLGVAAGLAGSAGLMAGDLGRNWGGVLGAEGRMRSDLPLRELEEKLSSLHGKAKSGGGLSRRFQRALQVRILRALASSLGGLKPGQTQGSEFEKVLRAGAEKAMWRSLYRPLALGLSVTLALLTAAALLGGCSGTKAKPDWVKPGTVAVDWPVLEGEVSGLIAWQARTINASLRGHILVEAPKVFQRDAQPLAEGLDYEYLIKPVIWKWVAVAPGEEKTGPHSTIPEHEFGFTFTLLDRSGKVLWKKSSSRAVSSKKGKLFISPEEAAGKAVRKILMTCPLAYGLTPTEEATPQP